MLAAGLWRDGRCHRAVVLDPLDDAARRDVVERLQAALPAQRVTGLVAALVERIGGLVRPTAADARELTVGDRDRIVLGLHAALVGDALECVCSCGCGEQLELHLSVEQLLAPAPAEPEPRERVETLPSGAVVHVRAARGADVERAAERALDNPPEAVRRLLLDCLGDPAASAEGVAAASGLLEELDPGADIRLRGACPACGAEVLAQLDPGAYLWAELEQWRDRLEREVHALACAYHWSEAEILALPPHRRQRYLELLDEEGFVA